MQPSPPRSLRKRLPAAFAAALASLACASGVAARADAQDPAGQTPLLQRWVEESAASTWASAAVADPTGRASPGEAPAAGVRVEVTVGRPGHAVRLAPCARVEPFLPPNARLWGRTYIGVRCVEGASWSTMVPVTVAVFGPALVATRPLPAGAMADPGAFRFEEVDWTRGQGLPVSDPQLLAEQAFARPLATGQVLRTGDLRTPQTVSAGDPVKIRLVGQGFSITAGGFAMAGAGEGQTLRVRTESGKMLVGTVRNRSVEVNL